MVTDSIAEFAVALSQASFAGKVAVSVPYTSIVEQILETLKRGGFIKSYVRRNKKSRMIEVELLFPEGSPKIHNIARVSRLSRRVYCGHRNLRSFKGGYGARIISTSNGVMSDREARREKIGGEILCEVW